VFVTNLPALKVLVSKFYLNGTMGHEPGYLVAAHCRNNRPILFTVHLESGALFSGLPIEALYSSRFSEASPKAVYDTMQLQPFSCLAGPVQCITYDHMKGCGGMFKIDGKDMAGHYLFTIDYAGDGLAEDPEQYKTHNIIELVNGHLAALPNNHCLFLDKFFTEDRGWPKYYRNSSYWSAGG